MGTRVPKVRGFGRPNRLIQELLIARAMDQSAASDEARRRQPGDATTMSMSQRCGNYTAQTGRNRLTPAQERRAAKKAWRHPHDSSPLVTLPPHGGAA